MAIFPKGLTHGLCSKMAIFSIFFYAIQARKMSCMIFWSVKSPFQAIKTRSSKSRKMAIFPKGLTLGFGLKMAIFPTFFFFRQYRPGKCLLRYSRTKIRHSRLQKKEFLKVEKLTFFPWLWSKNGHFSNFYFVRQCNPGKCLLGYSRRKKRLSRL